MKMFSQRIDIDIVWWCATLCTFEIATASNETIIRTTTTVPTMIWNDMLNAFKAVTNDTKLIEHIIPEMYESTMQSINPSFVFKMPNEHAPAGYDMLVMPRSDFEEPIFPNLTRLTMGGSGNKLSINLKTYEGDRNEWINLGLAGWAGSLSQPVSVLEQTHRNEDEPVLPHKIYPNEEIMLDIKTGNLDGRVQDIKIMLESDNQAELQEYMTNIENVYIARVNHPFGYSIKWQLKNKTTNIELKHDVIHQRDKRDVAKLYSMIKCSTGCDPLIFKGYGCYCGFGGNGVPADGIDRCCRQHDKCYEQSNCISYSEYFVPYVWKCYRGKPLCAIDHGEWGGQDSCAARLCQCDLRLSRCLRQFFCPNRRAICRSSIARRLQKLIFFD